MTYYFVYYRVAGDRTAALQEQVQQLFRRVETATGVRGRWMRRRDDASTYMEIYEGVGDARTFEEVLERESAPLGLQRHVERFVCA